MGQDLRNPEYDGPMGIFTGYGESDPQPCENKTAQRCLPQTQGIYIPVGGKFYHGGALIEKICPGKGLAIVASPDLGPDYIGKRFSKGEIVHVNDGWMFAVPEDQVESPVRSQIEPKPWADGWSAGAD